MSVDDFSFNKRVPLLSWLHSVDATDPHRKTTLLSCGSGWPNWSASQGGWVAICCNQTNSLQIWFLQCILLSSKFFWIGRREIPQEQSIIHLCLGSFGGQNMVSCRCSLDQSIEILYIYMLFWHVVAKNTLNNVKHTPHTLTQSYTLMRSLCNTYTKPDSPKAEESSPSSWVDGPLIRVFKPTKGLCKGSANVALYRTWWLGD